MNECVPGHPGRHRPHPRAVVPDLPLTRPPPNAKERRHATEQRSHRRGPAAHRGAGRRRHRRARPRREQRRQLPQAAEHLRRAHHAGPGRRRPAGNTGKVAEILRFADEHGVNVIPRTGGTATEGGLESAVPDSVIIDGSAMNEILSVDAYNMQATCQCGVPLQALEDRARELGLTTGHSPQSKPVAHLGGLVATRSIGQFSTLYGGIEDMVVGLEAVFPGGEVTRIKNVPRRAAGPDIRHVVIGNEGALCFITEVTVKLFPYFPENNVFLGWTLKRHEDRLRGAARGHGQRLQAVGGAGLRPRRRRPPLLPLRRGRRLRAAVHGRGGGRHRQGDRRGDPGHRRPPSRVHAGRQRLHRDLVQRPLLGPRARSRRRTSASARRAT